MSLRVTCCDKIKFRELDLLHESNLNGGSSSSSSSSSEEEEEVVVVEEEEEDEEEGLFKANAVN